MADHEESLLNVVYYINWRSSFVSYFWLLLILVCVVYPSSLSHMLIEIGLNYLPNLKEGRLWVQPVKQAILGVSRGLHQTRKLPSTNCCGQLDSHHAKLAIDVPVNIIATLVNGQIQGPKSKLQGLHRLEGQLWQPATLIMEITRYSKTIAQVVPNWVSLRVSF